MRNIEPIITNYLISNILDPFVVAVFTVVGGATPIAFLIYIFSRKEGARLKTHAKAYEDAIPVQQKLLEEIQKNLQESVNPENVSDNLDQFKKIMENYQLLEDNKKFVRYAKNYNFWSAIGQTLRSSNYMPKSIDEHREIAKNLPPSPSTDT